MIQVPYAWGSFPVTQPLACAGITWLSLSCTVGTGAQGTAENAFILATTITISNKVSDSGVKNLLSISSTV